MKINLTPAIRCLEDEIFYGNIQNQLSGEGQADRMIKMESYQEAVRILKEHRKALLEQHLEEKKGCGNCMTSEVIMEKKDEA